MKKIEEDREFQKQINHLTKESSVYIPKLEDKFKHIKNYKLHFQDFILRSKWLNKTHTYNLNLIYLKVISEFFYMDREFFMRVINKNKKAHLIKYFSPILIEEVRNDICLSILVYKNCKKSEKEKVKKILGYKVVHSSEFEYIFGEKNDSK